jgi:hypothetical protein
MAVGAGKRDTWRYAVIQIIDPEICIQCGETTRDHYGRCRAAISIDDEGKVQGPLCRKCSNDQMLKVIIGKSAS